MKKLSAAILFDLDGTLIHSAPDLRAAANHICHQRGIEPFDLETIISFIGNGVPMLVKRIFDARDIVLSDDDYQKAIGDYLDYYDQHSTDLTAPYDGVTGVLDWIKSTGVLMAVVTNKPEAPAVAILKTLRLDQYFEVVVGGDTTPTRKPDPAPYLTACQRLGIAPSRTIYIGDSETDARTAEAANVPFVLFTKGYRNLPIKDIAHMQKFDHFDHLQDVL
ncbi:MAG: phosphoglycolate phosphatase [Hyphomicrobiales bacterium]|nr:phosphoglycolate phosphatase [Hyphomicrobiales bacterium]